MAIDTWKQAQDQILLLLLAILQEHQFWFKKKEEKGASVILVNHIMRAGSLDNRYADQWSFI